MDAAGATHGRERRIEIGFGQVRHVRVSPLRRDFTYPVYSLRLRIDALYAPEGGSGAAPLRAAGGLVGIDRAAPIAFRSGDHGDGNGSPLSWIRGVLARAGIVADGAIWLQCFPRSFGLRFKPVSFWFCHRRDGALAAVVAEVNNTFGERHCYLLAHDDGSPIGAGERLHAQKRFHVSPFFDVDGGYRFRFDNAVDRFDACVDLLDDAGEIRLATRIAGHLRPATPAAAALALLRHPLLAAGVVARIHFQALRLWAAGIAPRRKPAAPTQPVTRGR